MPENTPGRFVFAVMSFVAEFDDVYELGIKAARSGRPPLYHFRDKAEFDIEGVVYSELETLRYPMHVRAVRGS